MPMSTEDRNDVFGELADMERRVNAKVEKKVSWLVFWSIVALLVGLASGAIYVLHDTSTTAAKENAKASAENSKTIACVQTEMKAVQKTVGDFRAEQRTHNEKMEKRFEDLLKELREKGEKD